jgi:hypothetical protein
MLYCLTTNFTSKYHFLLRFFQTSFSRHFDPIPNVTVHLLPSLLHNREAPSSDTGPEAGYFVSSSGFYSEAPGKTEQVFLS